MSGVHSMNSLHTKGIVECSSFPVGISQYNVDVVRYQPTDRPIEDRWSMKLDTDARRIILGVYDGHGGSATAEVVSSVLPEALLEVPPSRHTEVFEEVDRRIIRSFTDDHSFLRSKSDQWERNAKTARAGCMALIFDLDLKSGDATISNAGDCRLAVFHGQSGPTIELVHETSDLNSRAASEQERLENEHPGEDLLIVSGRLFGRLMCTRGFGDVYYKLPCKGPVGRYTHKKHIDAMSAVEEIGKIPINQQYDSYFYGYRTPPYITARPETSKPHISDGDTVILASDGLWDKLTTLEAASILSDGIAAGVEHLAMHLLQFLLDNHPPGDDTTIVILRSRLPENKPSLEE